MRTLGLALCVALVCLHCSGSPGKTPPSVPNRVPTSGDALLEAAPVGADLILEIDLARLRANAVVGPVVRALSSPDDAVRQDLLAHGASLLVCVYGVGDLAKQLIIVHANDGVELAGAAALHSNLFAVGDPELVARASALAGDGVGSMLDDVEMLRLRASAMPAEAEHAVVRAAARLNFDARVSVASRAGMSEVPVSLALWGDVIDDLAIVARVTGESERSHERLIAALLGLRDRIAKAPLVRHLGLAAPLRVAKLSRSGSTVQVVFVMNPGRLQFVAQRLARQLQTVASPSTP